MIYILLVVFSTGYGLTSSVAEFNNLQACNAAGAVITKEAEKKNAKIQVLTCLEKGKS